MVIQLSNFRSSKTAACFVALTFLGTNGLAQSKGSDHLPPDFSVKGSCVFTLKPNNRIPVERICEIFPKWEMSVLGGGVTHIQEGHDHARYGKLEELITIPASVEYILRELSSCLEDGKCSAQLKAAPPPVMPPPLLPRNVTGLWAAEMNLCQDWPGTLRLPCIATPGSLGIVYIVETKEAAIFIAVDNLWEDLVGRDISIATIGVIRDSKI